jgi:hypothetical protein
VLESQSNELGNSAANNEGCGVNIVNVVVSVLSVNIAGLQK